MNAVLVLLVAAAYVYPTWRICQKAGYPGWLGILMVIPVANLVLLYFLAFAEWPALQGVVRIERMGDSGDR